MTQANRTPINLPCPAAHLLSHRPPMLLLNELLTRQNNSATASASCTPENLCFSPDRGVSGEYFIEIMAQTMAAAHNYDTLANNHPLKNGYIAGVEAFALHSVPTTPMDLIISVETAMDLGSMKLMHGKVHHNDRLIAESELKVWVGE